jgi:hypothetical protein
VYREYEASKSMLLKQKSTHAAVDVTAYHGTTSNSPLSIVRDGFDVSKGSALPG